MSGNSGEHPGDPRRRLRMHRYDPGPDPRSVRNASSLGPELTIWPDRTNAMSELLPQETQPPLFVGRSAELRQLVAGLEHVLEGRGGMFLLSGEPGIGKTRVAEQLALEAQKRGAAVYWGRSTLAEGAPPYWPWVQILRSVLRDVGDAAFRRLAGSGLPQILQVVPDLRGHVSVVAPTSRADDPPRFGIYSSLAHVPPG